MSKKNELDQYYTKPSYASDCLRLVVEKGYYDHGLMVEPCAGTGAFFSLMPADNRLGLDLDPKVEGAIKQDFLKYTTRFDGATVVSNPPFGPSATLAVAFFNHCAHLGADVIAFVVPRTFRKASIQNKLCPDFHLVEDHDSPDKSFILDGEAYDVPCTFQVWVRKRTPRELVNTSADNELFDFCNKADADFAVRRVGGRAGQLLEGLDHTETSTYFLKSKIDKADLREILSQVDLEEERNNTAGVRSVAKYELVNKVVRLYNE